MSLTRPDPTDLTTPAGASRAASPSNEAPPVPTDWRPIGMAGLAVVTLTFFVFGTWTAVARLDSAAVANGIVSPIGSIRSVQHLEGGIVRELHVANGSRVAAGDLLIRLDTTQTQASATLFERQLAAAKASVARLEAEEALSAQIDFPEDVLSRSGDSFVQQALVAETARFSVGRDALDQQVKVIDSQNHQVEAEVAAYEAEAAAARDELQVVEQRMREVARLVEQGLMTRTEVLTMERDVLALRGRVAVAESEATQSRQRIAENRLRLVQFQQEYRQTAADALPDLRGEIRELERQLIVASDMLQRVEIRAPVDGIVQELKVFTVGAVIQPGEPLMNVAPQSEDLIVRANVSPLDADSVSIGMAAEVQFPAFQTMNLLPIDGVVVSRSGDRIIDPTTQASYFAVDVRIESEAVPQQIRNRLGAGMPASVVIPTGERTALAYLVDPLLSRFNVAMRER